MIKVGLTGGIGSGKSTVAELFTELGITVIDADKIAKALTAPNTPIFKDIIAHFGNDYVLPSGALDRERLKDYVFHHPQQRLWLEQTLHPAILQQTLEQLDIATGKYSIAVIPLLIEKNLQSLFDRILVVNVTEATQRNRIQQREHMTPELIQQILATQCQQHERLSHATEIINNEGDLAKLRPQVEALHHLYSTAKKEK